MLLLWSSWSVVVVPQNPGAAAAPLTTADITDEQLVRVVTSEASDEEVNVLVWKCLGYTFADGKWDNAGVFPKYREQYPAPMDVIGVTRTYTQQVGCWLLQDRKGLLAAFAVSSVVHCWVP